MIKIPKSGKCRDCKDSETAKREIIQLCMSVSFHYSFRSDGEFIHVICKIDPITNLGANMCISTDK